MVFPDQDGLKLQTEHSKKGCHTFKVTCSMLVFDNELTLLKTVTIGILAVNIMSPYCVPGKLFNFTVLPTL